MAESDECGCEQCAGARLPSGLEVAELLAWLDAAGAWIEREPGARDWLGLPESPGSPRAAYLIPLHAAATVRALVRAARMNGAAV